MLLLFGFMSKNSADRKGRINSARVKSLQHNQVFTQHLPLVLNSPLFRKMPFPMSGKERRLAVRHTLKIPLRVCLLKSAAPERPAESLNLSTRGICFATNLPLREGTPVQVVFEMPEEVTHEPASEWRCSGHVVHVRPGWGQQEEICVGVAFDCYEVFPLDQTSVRGN